jgi:flagellar L-ring protein FlgH
LCEVKKIRLNYIAALVLALLMAVPGKAVSDSLWAKKASPYAAPRAGRAGDLVTIIIDVASSSTLNADTNAKKTSEVNSNLLASWRRVVALIDQGGDNRTDGAGKITGGNKFSGAGQTSRGSNVRAVISAVVVQVMPNGNLELKGERSVRINEEQENILINGEVRAQDITADNTVLSSQIAGARITIEGSGPVGNQQSPGILTRFLNWLF